MNRDKYKSIHIHLENTVGGDSSPGQLLVKCLIGNKEKWMKNVKKIYKDDNFIKIKEWDSWKEHETPGGNNYERIKLLDLDFIPEYQTKYKGKIYVYMNNNASAVWYMITYLIYGFASKIKRFTKECYGQKLKFGSISKDSQLVLYGNSSTCSGDGNCVNTKLKDITISCPTIQFHTRSFHKKDWNRFWLGN